jgi:hypothetical protein
MNNEILNLKICNRILEADGPLFSGESVNIRLAIDAGEAVASKHKLVLFGFDKSALSESAAFSATENANVWESTINTATNEFATYFRNIPANASKSVGAMIVNTETGDTITRGNIAVISTPFPSELTPVPKPFEFVSEAEMQAAISACESSLSAEFESGLSSLSSDVADIEDGMRSLAESLRDLDTLKADAETVDDLAAEVANKADSSTVAELSSEVLRKMDIATSIAGVTDSQVLGAETAVGFIQDVEYSLHNQISEKVDASLVEDIIAEIEDKVNKSAVISSLTSLATDDEIPTAKSVYEFVLSMLNQRI